MVESVDTLVLGTSAFWRKGSSPFSRMENFPPMFVSYPCRDYKMIDYKKFENMEASAVKMTVGVSGDDTNRVYEKVLKDYCRKTSLPGFRKGKVPPQVILRKFGDGVHYEATLQLLNAALQEALEGVEKQPLSSPEIIGDLPKLDPGNPCQFSVTYDVFPEIELGQYRGVAISERCVHIDDTDRQKQLEMLAGSHAVYLGKDEGSVEDNSVVTLDFVELDNDNKEIVSSKRNDFVLNMGNTDNPFGIESQIMGMKIGETRVVKRLAVRTEQDGSEAGKTGEGSENTAADHPKIKVTVKELKERCVPDLNDEFARDISEDFKTLDDLKEKIRNEMEAHSAEKIRELKIRDITEKLLAESRVEPPCSMLERELDSIWKNYVKHVGVPENSLPESLKEKLRLQWKEDSLKSVKTRLVYGRIINEENLDVSNEEITAEIRKNAEKHKMSVEEWEKRFGGKAYRDYLRNQMVEKQLFDLLIDSAHVSQGEEIGYFELLNLQSPGN